jgi:hypothetical protein
METGYRESIFVERPNLILSGRGVVLGCVIWPEDGPTGMSRALRLTI